MSLSAPLQSTYSQNPATALFGQVRTNTECTTMKNAEASASIPMGFPVVFKTSGPTSDLDAVLPNTVNDLLAGIVALSYEYAPAYTDLQGNVHGQLDSTGIVAKALMNVVREGWVWVKCHTGCTPGQRLFVCAVTGGATYTAIGQLGNVTEAAKVIDATTKGEWKSTAVADTGAWLEMLASAK